MLFRSDKKPRSSANAEAMIRAYDGELHGFLLRRLRVRAETNNTPLADVAVELARYNALRLQIDGKTLPVRQLNGAFSADDPDSLRFSS